MLFEPGPLTLFTQAEIPTPVFVPEFAGLAAGEAYWLEVVAAELAGRGAILAAAGVNELEYHAAELGAAADEHDRQSRDSDPAIAGVAGAASATESELAGLSSELAQDLQVSVPSEPEIPPDGYGRGGVPPGTPVSVWDQIVMQQWRLLRGGAPTSEQLIYARTFEPDVDALKAWILDGGIVPGAPPPPPPPPPPTGPTQEEWYAMVDEVFVNVAGRHAFDGELYYTWLVFYPDISAIEPWIRAGTPT